MRQITNNPLSTQFIYSNRSFTLSHYKWLCYNRLTWRVGVLKKMLNSNCHNNKLIMKHDNCQVSTTYWLDVCMMTFIWSWAQKWQISKGNDYIGNQDKLRILKQILVIITNEEFHHFPSQLQLQLPPPAAETAGPWSWGQTWTPRLVVWRGGLPSFWRVLLTAWWT